MVKQITRKAPGGTVTSRVDYPITFGSGLDTVILPPKGRLVMNDISGMKTDDYRYIVVPTTGGK